MRVTAVAVLLAACGQTATEEPAPPAIDAPLIGKVAEGGEMIGKPAPSLDGVQWADNKAHPLSEDRGKVVLVRWWTDTCPLCSNSAPAFSALAKKYGDRLVIRAVYHNKVRGREVSAADAREMADTVGYPWLVGKDDDGWSVLRRWWGPGRSFTSVTFLLDKQGIVRAIHTGGEFHARDAGTCVYESPENCHREYEAVDRAVGALAR